MKPRVYVETTIPSFYHEIRQEPEMRARYNWTRLWWDKCSSHYSLFSSLAVIEELEKGRHPRKDVCLEMLSNVPLLTFDQSIAEIVSTYIEHHLMPRDPAGDALHLAIASYHRCHFLLTWNCRNLANANKAEHIRHMNSMLGLHVPTLTTPMELLIKEAI